MSIAGCSRKPYPSLSQSCLIHHSCVSQLPPFLLGHSEIQDFTNKRKRRHFRSPCTLPALTNQSKIHYYFPLNTCQFPLHHLRTRLYHSSITILVYLILNKTAIILQNKKKNPESFIIFQCLRHCIQTPDTQTIQVSNTSSMTPKLFNIATFVFHRAPVGALYCASPEIQSLFQTHPTP